MVAKKVSKKAREEYGAAAIKTLTPTEAIRYKPAQYVGSRGSGGLLHCVAEIVGNALDEVSNGHGSNVAVAVSDDGRTVTVSDDGRGIPVGQHPKVKSKDTLTVVFTEMNSGGKFDANSYKHSVGVHGQGATIVCALSEKLEVWSYRNKVWNYQTFAKGVAKTAKPLSGSLVPKPPTTTIRKGTVIRWTPDLTCFDKGSKLDTKALQEWLDNISWFVPRANITLTMPSGKDTTIHRPKGLTDRYEHDCRRLAADPLDDLPPFILHNEQLDVMIGWCSSSHTSVFSAVNGIATREGGTHVDAVLNSMHKAISGLKKRGDNFTKESLKTGLIAVVNVRMNGAEFSSQDKAKFTTRAIVADVEAALLEGKASFSAWLKKHRTGVCTVIERANRVTDLTASFVADKKLASELKTNKRGKTLLPKALVQSTTSDNSVRELYIVEGSSAAGSLVKARDPKFQEILPLTGKIPNLWKKEEKLYSNERIIDILRSIGYDPANPGVYRVGKIIIAADSDSDGSHVAALILGMLQKTVPDIIKAGKVFLLDAPLFIYRTDTSYLQGASRNELEAQVRGHFDPKRVTRVKGWGEATHELMREVACDLDTRQLMRVGPITSVEDQALLAGMLCEDVSARRELLGI